MKSKEREGNVQYWSSRSADMLERLFSPQRVTPSGILLQVARSTGHRQTNFLLATLEQLWQPTMDTENSVSAEWNLWKSFRFTGRIYRISGPVSK